jgi:hypothetical protein
VIALISICSSLNNNDGRSIRINESQLNKFLFSKENSIINPLKLKSIGVK